MEYVPSHYNEIINVVLAAKTCGEETIVRTPRGCYSNLVRPLEMDAYIRYSSEQKLIIIQIENVEAYEQIEEIAAVSGIDMLFFGLEMMLSLNEAPFTPDTNRGFANT